MFSAQPKTPRPTGKAGRYEYSQKGRGPSDNSPEGVFRQPVTAYGGCSHWTPAFPGRRQGLLYLTFLTIESDGGLLPTDSNQAFSAEPLHTFLLKKWFGYSAIMAPVALARGHGGNWWAPAATSRRCKRQHQETQRFPVGRVGVRSPKERGRHERDVEIGRAHHGQGGA